MVGFAGGILGGLAGLSGPLPILWANLRGWGKDERRGIFQTFNWTILTASLCLQAGTGFVGAEVLWLAAMAFPATLLGAWIGARTYHALSDREFQGCRARPVVSVRRRPGLEQPRRCTDGRFGSITHGRHA